MIKNEIQCDELEEVKTDLDQLRTSFEHEKVNQDKNALSTDTLVIKSIFVENGSIP